MAVLRTDAWLRLLGLGRSDLSFLVFYCMVSLAILWATADWTFPRIEKSGDDALHLFLLWLSLPIFLVFIWGLYRGVRSLRRIALEEQTIRSVRESVEPGLREVDSRNIASVEFSEVIAIVKGLPEYLSSSRMFKRIVEDARDYVYEGREAVVRPYKEELDRLSHSVSQLQNSALRLGILGTFVGLILAIQQLVTQLGSGGMALPDSVMGQGVEPFLRVSGDLFGALLISFGTSVSGLIVALLLFAFGGYLIQRQADLFRQLDEASGKLMMLARRATWREKGLLSSFAQVTESVNGLRSGIDDHMANTRYALEAFGDRVVAQSERIDSAIQAVSAYRDTWQQWLSEFREQQQGFINAAEEHRAVMAANTQGFMDRLNVREQQFLQELAETRDLLSTGRLGSDIRNSVSSAGNELAAAIHDHVDKIGGGLEASSRKIAESFIGWSGRLSDELRSVKDSNDALAKGVLAVTSVARSINDQLVTTDREVGRFLELRQQLDTTLQDVHLAQKAFQADILNATARLHEFPLDQRLEERVWSTATKSTAPLSRGLSDVGQRLAGLERSTAIISKAANTLVTLASTPMFKAAYIVLLTIVILAGISLIILLVLGGRAILAG